MRKTHERVPAKKVRHSYESQASACAVLSMLLNVRFIGA